jgi:hypothetical protein
MSFNRQALENLVAKSNGGVARHVRKRTDELTESMRETGFQTQKKGFEGIPAVKFQEIIQNQPIARASSFEIGMPPDQTFTRRGNRKSFADFLAKKALKEQGNSWIDKAFARNPHFKRAR